MKIKRLGKECERVVPFFGAVSPISRVFPKHDETKKNRLKKQNKKQINGCSEQKQLCKLLA